MGDSAQFLNDSDYTARFLEVGQPEVDRLIGVYNRMVDSLRAERQRVQEQHYFLGRILDVSPSGIVVLDLDGRIELRQPGRRRAAAASRGRAARSVAAVVTDAAARDDRIAVQPGEARVAAAHGGRRVRVQRGTFLDRGFPRSFFLLEELTEELRQSEKAAYEKLIRMMSHEVNNSVGASSSLLQSSLSYSAQLSDADRADFERALQIAIDRMGQLNLFMRSFADVVRLPPPVRQPVDLVDVLRRIEGLVRADREARGDRMAVGRSTRIRRWSPMDPVQMEQALLNIVKNAIEAIDDVPAGVAGAHRATASRGTVTVRLRRAGDAASPRDRGYGPRHSA